MEDAAPSHAIANFKNAAYMNKHGHKAENGEFYGMVFQDSDVAKWIEAASYSLLITDDKDLEKRIHIPQFTLNNYSISLKGEFKDGYYYLDVKEGDVITFKMDMTSRINRCNTKVAANSGKAAITVGPIVYCAEGVDNDGEVFGFTLDGTVALKLEHQTPMEIGGFSEAANDLGKVYTVTATGTELICDDPNELYFSDRYCEEKRQIKLIPYFMWGNRGLNQMRVWLPIK